MRSWPVAGSRSRSRTHCVIANFASSTARHAHTAAAAVAARRPCASSPQSVATGANHPRNFTSSLSHHRHPRLFPAHTTTPLSLVWNNRSHQHRHQTRTMATDDAYLSFLDKANAALNAGRSAQTQTQSVGGFVRTETVDIDVRIPESLREVDTVYESETDEPFEPVALRWEGAVRGVWPGPSQFSTLISPSTDLTRSITTMSPNVFDPKDRYSTVMRAVRAAAASEAGDQINVDEAGIDVKVYRVEVGKSRVEYWVLALEAEGGKIIGMRARAVET